MFFRNKFLWLSLILILCLYLIFPSGLSTSDGWYYAASIKHVGEIFLPHHLLYNSLGLVFSWLPSKLGFDTISSLKVMNAIFAFLTLLVIQKLLYLYKLTDKNVILITCLSGISFSVIRYATENETYIVPLFFAIIASFSYIKYLNSGASRYAFYSGMWAAIAVLFHQIYIFWWMGLLIGFIIEEKKRAFISYTLISLIAPVIYLIVIVSGGNGSDWKEIWGFLLGDFNGGAKLELTGSGILMTFINLIRSFIQVHGYILNMVKENLFLLLPGVVSIFFVVIAFLKFPGFSKTIYSKRFITVHIIILVLQLIFALFSAGNAEFMVMIPVIIFILIPFFTIDYEKFLLRILLGMAIWNISYGFIPLHYKSQAPEQYLSEIALVNKNTIVVASDALLIKSMIYYQTGNFDRKNIYESPAVLSITGKEVRILEDAIDNALNSGNEIFTNCLDETVISRSSIMEGTKNGEFFRKYRTTLIKSWKQVTGTRSIFKIEGKL